MTTENFEQLVQLQETNSNASGYTFEVIINREHAIFKGHFPERAILPGVAMVEIFRRATELATGKKLRMKSSKSLKFLKMVEPSQTTRLNLSLSFKSIDKKIVAQGELNTEEGVYFKEMATFIED
ncbi:3-hydroxyacyl-[acyl-carrier-protein] dehydratase [Reichenbachiella faecimaris]|uniref:3-hydroxyacyl-[acyl-carrier-protein] dehydratase n=1 Tax=Reichenbachiella faecimaris TaxID=692418 RepID=A0A1W2G6N7_REIFA|nr:hypothetical protein [Reichenbachiella faecimaris]SMD32174.1 3-hydroxyacyl-[acyl-carrier-protein] dehydratase [Reichenbachiella faecimaris]